MKKVTIKDIARLANVSVSTVSRVINNDPGVAAETQDKIQKIIAHENYQPSMIARGMVSQKTRMIAVIVSDITNPYFHELVAALEKKLLNSGYSLSLFDSQTALKLDAKSGVSVEIETINQIRKNHFDATIILGGLVDRLSIPDPYFEALKNLVNEMPTIVVGSTSIKDLIHNKNLIYLDRDQTIPIKLLTNYMLRKGYKKFIFVGGNDSTWVTQTRTNIFKENLLKHNISTDNITILNNNFYPEDGYNAAKYIIKNQISFDAVVTINDRVASGFLRGMQDLSNVDLLDFGLASCEFFEESRFYIPRITSIDHNISLLGATISNTLINTLENNLNNSSVIDVTPKLIIGETC